MNIKDKILAIPNPYSESLSKDRVESMKVHCAEVAQTYIDERIAKLHAEISYGAFDYERITAILDWVSD